MNLMCKVFGHKPGYLQSAVGGRNVQRCRRCDQVVYEESIMGRVTLPSMPRPKGKERTEL